jgi:metal-responsive CopG/Arc/MetJ family transcriptional regulator
MVSKHLNITLPEELVAELNLQVNAREKSAFIADSIKEKLERIRKDELRKKLEVDYLESAEEDREFCKEWEAVDLEGWDD